MSGSRSPRFAKQSVVSVLGFFALSLFVINFFTFLSHVFSPEHGLIGDRVMERTEARVDVEGHRRGDRSSELGAALHALRQTEGERRRIHVRMQCAEGKARHAEAMARYQESKDGAFKAAVGAASAGINAVALKPALLR